MKKGATMCAIKRTTDGAYFWGQTALGPQWGGRDEAEVYEKDEVQRICAVLGDCVAEEL